jgi:hypothetical protein
MLHIVLIVAAPNYSEIDSKNEACSSVSEAKEVISNTITKENFTNLEITLTP